MLNSINSAFTSIYGAGDPLTVSVTSFDFIICCMTSIVLGLACAFIYMFRHEYTKNFVVTLALLPLIVQMVITLVNGNLGAGIAVMGVFNLVRFRSIPGTAKDIGSVFLAMAIGLATGMGYLVLAVLFTIIVAIVNFAFVMTPLGNVPCPRQLLRISIPEDLEYSGVFNEVLTKYTKENKLLTVETTNMGSLFSLEYSVVMKDENEQKSFIDELRCLNGNLKISLGYMPAQKEVL